MKYKKYRDDLLEGAESLQERINILKVSIKNRYFMIDSVKIDLTPKMKKEFKSQIKGLESDREMLLGMSKPYIK